MDFRTWRETLDYTQAEMAEILGTTQVAISQWEAGKRKPNLVAFAKLVKYIPASPKFLLEIFVPEIMKGQAK